MIDDAKWAQLMALAHQTLDVATQGFLVARDAIETANKAIAAYQERTDAEVHESMERNATLQAMVVKAEQLMGQMRKGDG
jgi:hypothetical protein